MSIRVSRVCCAVLLFIACSAAQQQSQANCAPGPERLFEDELLDKLAGNWNVTGDMKGGELAQRCSAEWVLNHKFLRLDCHETRNPPLLKIRYESTMYIGCSSVSSRYVVNLVDIFGAGDGLGFGQRAGNSLRFVWEYPDGGAFENDFTWHPNSRTWTSSLRQKDPSGKWTRWGEKTFQRQE